MNKGINNLPNVNNFLLQSKSENGNKIIVNKKSTGLNSLEGKFIFGVFGREACNFNIIYMPNFDKIFNLQFQKLISIELLKDKYYYFDYFNHHTVYSTLMYTEDSDVTVSAL